MHSSETEYPYWKVNVLIASIGAFTTIIGMTMLLPFLPLYVEQLGAVGEKAIAQWSGIAYGATFFSAAFVAPLWGRLGDKYGRKLMLVRASFGMAIAIALMGMVGNLWQLVALRLLTGLAGGYASGASILAATQAPKAKSGWALGVVTTGIMAGNFLGPLIGGILPQFISLRQCFWFVGGLIFLTFLATAFFIKEDRKLFKARRNENKQKISWSNIPNKTPIILMLLSGALLTFSMMSIEPIITLYIQKILWNIDAQKMQMGFASITTWAGVVMSLTALGSAFSAGYLGRLADKIGHWKMVIYLMFLCALTLIPQAFVNTPWQLALLRFIMGLFIGGLMPAITAVLRHNVAEKSVGVVLGFAVSASFVGQVAGPLLGGFIAGHVSMQWVFIMTAIIMVFVANLNLYYCLSNHYK